MATPLRLKELASSLGLSIPTVSLALRNAGNISAKTCARVQKAAKAMGYRPNPYAAALSTGWHNQDAHEMPLAIISWATKRGMFYPTTEVAQGIEERAAQLGYRLEKCNLSTASELPRCLRLLYNRGIQGVFVAFMGDDPEPMQHDWSHFCVLACGRYNFQTPFHTIRPEIFETTRELLSKAVERGYKRIGAALYHHDPPLIDDFARISTIRGVLNSPEYAKRVDTIMLSKPEDDSGLAKWVRKTRPDAVIVFSVGQYHTLVENGIRVPEDIAVATLHCQDDHYSGHISGFLQQQHQIGIAAVNHMDFMIRHHERGIPKVPQHIAIPSKWSEGTTLPDKSKEASKPGKRRARSSKVSC